MPITPVVVPRYPDVPDQDGVPDLLKDPTRAVFTEILVEADVSIILNSIFLGPQWGIFTATGLPVLFPDTMITFDARREFRISDYPVEQGGFESYDKVQVPSDIRIRLGCDGSTTPMDLFLLQVDNAAESTNLYVVVTPDKSYPSMNITHYDSRRTRETGLGVLQVDVWFQEIRETVQVRFTNTKDPTGAAQINAGSVQAGTPTPAQAAQLPVPPIPPTRPPPPFLSAGPDTSNVGTLT